MENAINTLRIQNFKSIKDVTMNPRRINLIIGMPNVGKSNILEAMSLLGGMFFDEKGQKFMKGQIRYEDIRNLFYDGDWSKEIDVRSEDLGATRLRAKDDVVEVVFGNGGEMALSWKESMNNITSSLGSVASEVFDYTNEKDKQVNFDRLNNYKGKVDTEGVVLEKKKQNGEYNYLKKFAYAKYTEHGNTSNYAHLKPPHGDNMIEVLQRSGDILRKEIAGLFKPYGLNFALRIADRKFEIQKNIDGYIYSYPYSLTADTLQRMIFYLAAIESNDDSILLFEEPEAHTFPVYTSMLGRKIAASHNNQFFIATHSPYLVTEILEQMLPEEEQEGELAIFLAYYEDYQTKVKQLSNEEIREIRNDSIDVFYNLSRFTPGSNSYA